MLLIDISIGCRYNKNIIHNLFNRISLFMNQFLASVLFILITGFRCDAKAADTSLPLSTVAKTSSSNPMKLFVDTATQDINHNRLSIIRVEKLALQNETNLKALEDRLSAVESVQEAPEEPSETPVLPEPVTRKEQLKGFGKGLFKSVTQFGLFKLLLLLCK